MLPPLPPKNTGSSLPPLPPKKKEGTELSSINLPAGSPVGGSAAPSTENNPAPSADSPFKFSPNNPTPAITTPIEAGSTTVVQDRTGDIAVMKQEKVKNDYLTNTALKYLATVPNLSSISPDKLKQIKDQAVNLGIPADKIDEIYTIAVDKQRREAGLTKLSDKRDEITTRIKKGTGDYDILPVPGSNVKPLGITPQKPTPEMVDKELTKYATNIAINEFPDKKELYYINKEIERIENDINSTAEDYRRRLYLVKQRQELGGGARLFNPITGNFEDEPNAETEKYAAEVDALSEELKRTPRQKLGEKFFIESALFEDVQNKYLEAREYSPEEMIKLGLGNYQEPRMLSLKDIYGMYSTIGMMDTRMYKGKQEEELYAKANAAHNEFVQSRKNLDALTDSYLLNIDPGKGNLGLLDYAGTGFLEGLENSNIIGPIVKSVFGNPEMTDVQKLETYATMAGEAGVNLTETQKKEVENTLTETVFRSGAASGPMMGDIVLSTIMLNAVGGTAALEAGITKLAFNATKNYGAIAGAATKILGEGVKTAITFEMAGAGGTTGVGEGIAQGLLERTSILSSITGKFAPLLKVAARTSTGALGETFGEYAGEFANALSNNGFDYDKVIDDTFGKDLDEATKKGLATLITSLLFSGASNTTTLIAGKEWLNNQDIPNKDELLAEIDKKIAEGEATPPADIPADVPPTDAPAAGGEVVLTPTEEIQNKVAEITTQEDAKKLAEDVMFSDLPKEEKQALLNEILTKQEEILQSQPVVEDGAVDIPAPVVEETAPVEATPVEAAPIEVAPIEPTPVVETAPVVETTPTKEPIPIGQKLEYRDTENGPRLMNRETGKPADLGSIRTYEDTIIEAKKQDWINEGVTVEDDQNKIAYFNDVESNSTNPFQIAEAFVESEAFPFEDRGTYKDDFIADQLNGSVINKQSFIDYADVSHVAGISKPSPKSKKPGFIFGEERAKGTDIGSFAEAATNRSGVEITEQDVVNFMTNYGSVEAYWEQKKNPNAKGLQQKFKDLTGMPLNAKLAEKLAAQNLENRGLALAKQEQLFLESEATNYEQVKQDLEAYLDNNPAEAERFYAGRPITGEAIQSEVSNVSEQSNEGTKGEGTQEVNIAEQTAEGLESNWEETLLSLKINIKGTLGINIAPVIWNGGIDAVILAIKGGAKIAEAIAKGVDYISQNLKQNGATDPQITRAAKRFENDVLDMVAPSAPEGDTRGLIRQIRKQVKIAAKNFRQGQRQGISDAKKAGKEFAAKIAEAIKPLGSRLNPSQIKALVGRAAKVSTERQLEKFQEYAEKVIEDANYADNLAAIAKAIKQLKRNVKDRNSIKIKEIAKLDLSELTVQQISELNDVLAAANQRVPDTSLLEAYNVPVTNKPPRQAKSLDDYTEYRDEILGTPVNDLDDVRKVVRKLNTARRMLDMMLAQGMISDAEYDSEMKILDDTQNLETSKFKQDVDDAKRQAVDNIQTNLKDNWDKDNFTAEENDFIGKLKSLTGDEMFNLNIGDLDALSDVSDRIANGTIPLNVATSIYGRAIGKARGAKVAEQVNEAAKKGIIPSDGQISETGGTAKELARAEAQSVEDVLNLGRGRAIYSYLYNVFSRAATAIMRSNDALFKKYKDVAGEEGITSKVILKVGSWVGAGTKLPKFVKKRILQKSKVMMVRYASMARNTKGSIYGFEISSIDYFGLLLGNEAAYDALIPTDGNNDVEAAKQQIRDRIEEQIGAYKTKRDGKIDGISQLDIMREVYETFPKKSDGSVDWDAITLTPQEQKIADVVSEILEELRNKQRFANEAKGLPFEEQFDYIKTDWLKRDSDFSSAENSGKEGTRAGSSYVRTDFRPGALNINLDQLMANSIDETNKDYYFTNADMEIKPTLAYAGEGIISKKAKDVVKVTLKQDLSARKDFFNSKFSVHPYIRRLMNAGYIGALVNISTRAIDTLVSTGKIPLLLGSPKPLKAIFSPLQRKAFAKLIEMTDSSLGTKLSKWKDPSFEGKRSDPNLFERVTNSIISVDETVNLVGAWMPNFTMEFASLAGEEFDLNKFVSDPDYAEEFRREIEDAASYADREAKKIYGGGSKFEQRRAIQIFPVFRGLDADSYPGVFAAYLGSFGYRERVLLWQAMSDMVLARNQDRPIAALRAFGVMKATIAYGMLASAAYAGKMILTGMLTGDEEEEKKGRQMLKDLSSPEGIMKEAGASLGLLGLSKYGQAGRYLSTLSLSVMYANTKDKGTQELIKTFMKENLYSRPITMSKEGVVVSASELIPPLTASLSSIFKMVNGGYGYGKKNPDAISAIYDKYEKGGIDALTKTEQDKWALITLTYNMMTLVGSQFGYAPPFKADLERVIKTQLKEADKKR